MEGSRPIISTGSDKNIIVRDQAVDGRDVFECKICMDRPTNSVLTSCGHLFCWSCLYRWLQIQDKLCPVCKLRVEKHNIVPFYGCQKGSVQGSCSRVDGAIPPRPSAPLTRGRPPSWSTVAANTSTEPNYTALLGHAVNPLVTLDIDWFQRQSNRQAYSEFVIRDLRREILRTRAQADFREIRASHPPSSTGWIAEASFKFAREFDPYRASRARHGPVDDLHVFISGVLVPQGEYFPGVDDFRRSWLPYYEAQNPELSEYERYNEFLEAWGRHFHRAWDRAGRPGSSANATEAPVESLQPSAASSSGAGSGSTASHDGSGSESECEVEEIDASEYERALQQSGESGRIGRESRRASRRSRPY